MTYGDVRVRNIPVVNAREFIDNNMCYGALCAVNSNFDGSINMNSDLKFGSLVGITMDYTIEPDAGAEYIYTQMDNGISLIRYTGSRKNPVIPRTIGGINVVSIEPACFNYSEITGAVVSDGITAIY